MFNHILLPLDGSQLAECVLPHILPIAQTSHTQVTLLNVLEQFSVSDSSQTLDVMNCAIRKVEAQTYLAEMADRLSKAGLNVDTALAEGKPAEQIIDYAHLHKVSLIVLSSHGRNGLSDWNISSVVQKVLLRAYSSLLIIPAYLQREMEFENFRYQRVFVALDGSLRAEWVLPTATEIAARHQASLTLATVVSRPEMPSHLPLSYEEVGMVNRVIERNRRYAEEYLERLCARLQKICGDIQTNVVVCDNPVDALHELVEQARADLVVLSAHGFSGGYKRPYGSVTLSFIAYGTKPLLILQDISQERRELTQVESIVKERSGH